MPGFNKFCGSKIRFTSTKTSAKGAILLADEGGAAEPGGVFAADRAADVEDFAIQVDGQRGQLGGVGRVGQIEKGPDVQLAVAGVGKERSGDFVLLEHVLHPHQKVGQRLGRDGQVLDEGDRPAGALHA